MIPEIGQFALILALCIAIVQSVLPLAGASIGIRRWVAIAKPAALGQFLFVAIAYACLTWAFLDHDFSVLYVAKNSNTQLPLIYLISGVWGSHEGSLLLWSLILSIWSAAVALFSANVPNVMRARVLGVMGLVSVGFLLFILLTSNPFDRLFPAIAEGSDLNPLLQDIGLAIHPPMLYIGYVGFSVAFAFSIAALLSGSVDSAWARWSRPWTNVAWLFLTLGIALGSWWAYYELGWGGWWFWDPVENASFMPWLVGTALMHSLAITEKRGTFKAWTCVCQRSRTRRVHSRLPVSGYWRLVNSLCMARTDVKKCRADSITVARNGVVVKQYLFDGGSGCDIARHPVSHCHRCDGWKNIGGTPLF
jgi:cytochrome c-type biogenesis protein CcmF